MLGCGRPGIWLSRRGHGRAFWKEAASRTFGCIICGGRWVLGKQGPVCRARSLLRVVRQGVVDSSRWPLATENLTYPLDAVDNRPNSKLNTCETDVDV
jgi:hypothetical protein